MRLSRERAKGEGAAQPRRPGPPRAPRPARTPAPLPSGRWVQEPRGWKVPAASLQRSPRSGCGRGACAELPVLASHTAAPGRSAQARARRHTLTHWLAPPQPASRCDRSPATRSKKTCPRYGACAKAFPSPGGVSRGGVRCSAGLRDAAGDGNPFCLQCGEI